MQEVKIFFIQIQLSSNLCRINAKQIPMILILPDKSEIILDVNGRSIEELLITRRIDPLTVLVSRGDEIIPEDTIPEEEDIIRIIQVSHGG